MLELPVMFPSQGDFLSGVFYRNTGVLDEPQAAVIITGSWLTVKEQMAATYAQRLAELGCTTLIFDFAGFGQSSGSPRQAEIPSRKIANIRDAAEFVSTLSFVRAGAVGHLAICASAQYTLAAIAGSILYALNANTGALEWTYAVDGTASSPAAANGVVYISSSTNESTSNLYALNASTGQLLWSYFAKQPSADYAGFSPVVANGMVYTGCTPHNVCAFGLR